MVTATPCYQSLTPATQQFLLLCLDNLTNIGNQMSQAQEEVSTGLQINSVSDAPDLISPSCGRPAATSSPGNANAHRLRPDQIGSPVEASRRSKAR